MSAHLELSGLGKSFEGPSGPSIVVEGFDLRLARGEFVCLLGHSGCGKSTVLAMVAGLLPISAGGVVLDGREIDGARPRPRRGVPGAEPAALADGAPRTCGSASTACIRTARSKERHAIAAHFLERVGLGDALGRRPGRALAGASASASASRAPSRWRPSCSCSTSPSGCSTRSRAWSSRTCCSSSGVATGAPR